VSRRITPALLAWRVVPKLPESVARALFTVIAVGAWARRGKGVRQLEANLARVRPLAGRRAVRRLARQGMVSYLRYFAEIFQAHRFTARRVAALVRVEGREELDANLGKGLNPVLALAHMGNWDLAGAWASRELGAVTTVAERLEPPSVFRDFAAMRARLGITIIPGDAGRVFRPLLQAAVSGPPGIVPVLADRDLGSGGVEVTMFGHRVRVAAGPAVLACKGNIPLLPLAVISERLTGKRRREAGSRWGYVLIALPEIPRRRDLDSAEEIQAMTQGWANALAGVITAHPADWHMLSKVFVADLDPAKDAQIRKGGQENR
jgi:KDO2-lipid IV(A) lauroyltransferase